jgi:hypothetical protein
VDDKWGKKNEEEYSIWLDYKHEVSGDPSGVSAKCPSFTMPCIGGRSHRQNTRCDMLAQKGKS